MKHDFSQSAVMTISSQIESLKQTLEDNILSLENMPFSWRNISFNGAIQWAETLLVRNDKNRMSTALQNALTAYGQKVGDVEQADDTVSKVIAENVLHLQAISDKLQQLVAGVHKDPSVSGSYAGLRTTILNIDKSNGTLDFEKMTDAEREQYYQDCINMDPKDVTETDRRLMQEYCEKYLEPGVKAEYNMSAGDKAKRDKYIALYEKANPEEAADMQQLFYNAPGEYKDDVANIKAIAYMSEGDAHTVFFANLEDMKITEYKAYYDGNPGNYFSPKDKAMHINIESIRGGGYGTFFHEAGHNIDYLLGDGTYYSHVELNDGEFHTVMYDEVEKTVRSYIDDYSNNEESLTDAEKDLIADVLMGRTEDTVLAPEDFDTKDVLLTIVLGGGYGLYTKHEKDRVGRAYREIYEEITGCPINKDGASKSWSNNGPLQENSTVSEVFCGITNNALMPMTEDNQKVSSATNQNRALGHPWGYVDYDYYYETGEEDRVYYYGDDMKNRNTEGSGTEFMAEYFRINMTQSTSEEQVVKKYLGETWTIMEEGMAEEAAKIKTEVIP